MARPTRPKKQVPLLPSLPEDDATWRALALRQLEAQGFAEADIQAGLGGIVHYLKEVLRWGQRVDLIAPSSLEEFLDLSLADAAVIAHHVWRTSAAAAAARPLHWLDVGSGGGAPGFPLALLLLALWPESLSFTFVEPREKRVAFLRNLLGSLALPKAQVLRSRSDILPPGFADVALARATLPPPEWTREGARLAPRVWVLVARDEPPSPLPGWQLSADISYEWPLTQRKRRALYYERGPLDG